MYARDTRRERAAKRKKEKEEEEKENPNSFRCFRKTRWNASIFLDSVDCATSLQLKLMCPPARDAATFHQ